MGWSSPRIRVIYPHFRWCPISLRADKTKHLSQCWLRSLHLCFRCRRHVSNSRQIIVGVYWTDIPWEVCLWTNKWSGSIPITAFFCAFLSDQKLGTLLKGSQVTTHSFSVLMDSLRLNHCLRDERWSTKKNERNKKGWKKQHTQRERERHYEILWDAENNSQVPHIQPIDVRWTLGQPSSYLHIYIYCIY